MKVDFSASPQDFQIDKIDTIQPNRYILIGFNDEMLLPMWYKDLINNDIATLDFNTLLKNATEIYNTRGNKEVENKSCIIIHHLQSIVVEFFYFL